MKPQNKLQKKILELSRSLPPLTDFQKKEAIRKVAPHIAKYNSKKEYVCLDCGHSWTGDEAGVVRCPHCSAHLTVNKSRVRNYKESCYVAIVTKCSGFQIIRTFFMEVKLKRGQAADYWFAEAFQRWLSPECKSIMVGRARYGLSHYVDSWDWSSDMEIREENAGHQVSPYDVVGHTSVIPELKRNGFKGDFHDCDPYMLFSNLLKDNRIETAWKTGQYELVRYILMSCYPFDNYWPSIKVAIRHKYKITDAASWFDMLRSIDYVGKDIKNPILICPDNFMEAHDYWISKRLAKEEKERRERERQREMTREQRYLEDLKRVAKDEAAYAKAKSKFFDLELLDREIVIRPLTSVKEFVEEGHSLCHCVFSNKYYQNDSVLILHALVNNASIATIELSLENFAILQCRGKHNQTPPMYDRIISLVKSGIPTIMSKLHKLSDMTQEMMIAMEAINKWLYHGWNYEMTEVSVPDSDNCGYQPIYIPQFLAEAKWTCNLPHMIGKWDDACRSKNPDAYLSTFYASLDNENRRILLEWVLQNYNTERKLF